MLAAAAAVMALAGCSTQTRRTLGLEKTGPDAFLVVKHAPLSLPPDYALRPPEPGAPRPGVATPEMAARRAVFGLSPAQEGPTIATRDLTSGEMALLEKAGATHVNPDIRALVDQESTILAKLDLPLTEKLVFWRKPPPAGTVVDPEKEAQRLREDAALGRPVTNGETPMIKRKQEGILQGLF